MFTTWDKRIEEIDPSCEVWRRSRPEHCCIPDRWGRSPRSPTWPASETRSTSDEATKLLGRDTVLDEHDRAEQIIVGMVMGATLSAKILRRGLLTVVEAHLCKEPPEVVSLEFIACIDGSFETAAVVYTRRQVGDNEKSRHYHFSTHNHDVRSCL